MNGTKGCRVARKREDLSSKQQLTSNWPEENRFVKTTPLFYDNLSDNNHCLQAYVKMVLDPMTTAAAIDRLVHHSVILELNLPSYRMTTAKQKTQKEKEKKT